MLRPTAWFWAGFAVCAAAAPARRVCGASFARLSPRWPRPSRGAGAAAAASSRPPLAALRPPGSDASWGWTRFLAFYTTWYSLAWQDSDIESQIRRDLSYFDSPAVSLTLHTEQVTFRSFRGGVKVMITAAAWEYTALQFTTNASLFSSVKAFKPHLPSSSSRTLPNSPIYTFKCKANIRWDPSPETTLVHFTSSIYCSVTSGIWPTCWTHMHHTV